MTATCAACMTPLTEPCPHQHTRGHKTVLDEARIVWVYADDGEEVDDSRPCARCDRYPEDCRECGEAHDACLGHIEGATSACCGHGLHVGHVMIGRFRELEEVV